MPTLYLMMGYPGAGKTTIAGIIHELTGAIHLSSDKLRVEMFERPDFTQAEHDKLYQALDEKTESLLREGKDVIYDANLNRVRHRREKYAICRRTGAEAVLIWVKTPLELARQRAVDEKRLHLVPKQETPERMFERIAHLIEEPDSDEPHIAIDGSQVTSRSIAQTLGL